MKSYLDLLGLEGRESARGEPHLTERHLRPPPRPERCVQDGGFEVKTPQLVEPLQGAVLKDHRRELHLQSATHPAAGQATEEVGDIIRTVGVAT